MRPLLISTLAKLVNVQGLTSGVTITIPGGIVSGVLISPSEYFSLLSGAVAAGKGDWSQALAEAFAKASEDLAQASETEPEVDDVEPPEILYFKDATLFLGVTPAPIGLWTCRLADVTGFGMGVLNVSRD